MSTNYQHTPGTIPYRKDIFREDMEYNSLTISEMSDKDRKYVLKQIIKINSGKEAEEFISSNSEVNILYKPWQYNKVDLHGRIGILRYKGIEVALFIQRQLTKKRIDSEHPVSEAKRKHKKRLAGEPMSDVTREGKMICKHCLEQVTPVTMTTQGSQQYYSDMTLNLTCKGTWTFHDPQMAPSVSRETSGAQKCKHCGESEKAWQHFEQNAIDGGQYHPFEAVALSRESRFKHNHSAGSDYCPACTAVSGEGGEPETFGDPWGGPNSAGIEPAVAAQGQKDQTGQSAHPNQSWEYKASFDIAKMLDKSTAHYDVLKIMNVFAEHKLRVGGSPVRSVEGRLTKEQEIAFGQWLVEQINMAHEETHEEGLRVFANEWFGYYEVLPGSLPSPAPAQEIAVTKLEKGALGGERSVYAMSGESVRQRARELVRLIDRNESALAVEMFNGIRWFTISLPPNRQMADLQLECLVDSFEAALKSESSLSCFRAREDSEKLLKRCLEDAKDINSYSVKDSGGFGERLLKVAAYTTGMIIRLENQLAKYHERGRKVEG